MDRHGPLLASAVGRCLTGIRTPTRGLLPRRSALAWGSRAPVVFDFEGLLLEFEWNGLARSITVTEMDMAVVADDPEGWYRLGEDRQAPAGLAALTGQRLWAVDVLEVRGDECDLSFAFDRGYLAMTSSCCCTLILSCGPQQRRRLRLAAAGPTRDGYPPTAVVAPRGRPAWPPAGTDPSMVWAGRGESG
ncbi:hypothetical protein [Catenulispora sp. GP43]|uniref:hypothetical protein n=1 Tax=Catenulispora sp. GP43 TaxID=3156263 RepID=UPI003517ACBE